MPRPARTSPRADAALSSPLPLAGEAGRGLAGRTVGGSASGPCQAPLSNSPPLRGREGRRALHGGQGLSCGRAVVRPALSSPLPRSGGGREGACREDSRPPRSRPVPSAPSPTLPRCAGERAGEALHGGQGLSCGRAVVRPALSSPLPLAGEAGRGLAAKILDGNAPGPCQAPSLQLSPAARERGRAERFMAGRAFHAGELSCVPPFLLLSRLRGRPGGGLQEEPSTVALLARARRPLSNSPPLRGREGGPSTSWRAGPFMRESCRASRPFFSSPACGGGREGACREDSRRQRSRPMPSTPSPTLPRCAGERAGGAVHGGPGP
ncbi:hypothetical protein QO014_000530 [Kaistia dalseonensis]|uniref:Uncharacterized protein n=1 Tax=Kaistia dalseonensis TaxID=410840 RepID=A0ABU0H1H3_9HYPH|nr:hypothetical protein [Kaistia dalseonensis]